MTLERLQCPSCGSPLSPDGRAELFCSYCGARLRVEAGASGHPLAVLNGIREDTSLMAKRAACQHLQEEIQRQQAERERLAQERAALTAANKQSGSGCWLAGLVLPPILGYLMISGAIDWIKGIGWKVPQALLAVGLLALGLFVAVGPLVLIVQGVVEERRRAAQVRSTRARLEASIGELESSIKRSTERLQALKGEIDRAIGV